MTYLRLLWVYLRVGAMNELEYRANFFVQLFQSVLQLATTLAGLAVVFAHTDTLGGWRQSELLVLLGVYFLMGGLIWTMIRPSMQRFMEDVRQGTLDFTLTKPADSQVLVSVREIEIWRVFDFALGLAVLLVGASQLGARIGPGDAAAFALALVAGGAIVYSFWLILATFVFWFVRIDNILVIFETMYGASRWPVGIYPGWLRYTLTFLVPVAFATTVPAEALAGRLTGTTLVGAVALAIALLALSRWFWRFGVRHYSGASA